MKKYIIPLLILLILVGTSFLLIPKKENNNLKKIKVADTTLTSRSYMN